MISGADEPGIELSQQLEELWLEAENEAKQSGDEPPDELMPPADTVRMG